MFLTRDELLQVPADYYINKEQLTFLRQLSIVV